jgi:hypothetical protein
MSELHAKNLVRTVARAFYDDVSAARPGGRAAYSPSF